MQIKTKDSDSNYPEILIRTSERGGFFAIHIISSDEIRNNSYQYGIKGKWPHLNVSQAKRLIKELKTFVNNQVISEAIREKGE